MNLVDKAEQQLLELIGLRNEGYHPPTYRALAERQHQQMLLNMAPPQVQERQRRNPAGVPQWGKQGAQDNFPIPTWGNARRQNQQQQQNHQFRRQPNNEVIYVTASSDEENQEQEIINFPDFIAPAIRDIGYVPFGFRPLNHQRAPVSTEPPKPPPILPKRQCTVMGINYTIPILPEQALKLIENALKLAPESNFAKASAYLDLVIRTDKYPDDIVDRLVLAANDIHQYASVDFQGDAMNILKNQYNNISINFLRSAFMHNKSRLINTIDSLTSKPPAPMKSVRGKVNSMTITNYFITYDLMQLEKRELAKKAEQDAEAREKAEIEEARANGSLIECGCCFCEVPFDRCLQCPEGHIFCKDCVMKMIETTISEGRSSVKCPAMDGCGLDIPMSQLERAIPEKTLQRLFQTEAMNDVIRSGIPNLVKCANCGFIVEFLGSSNMRCPQCQKETCSKCGLLAHPGKTCEEAKAVDPEKLIEEKMNDAIIRVCPNCNTPFMKDEGCNKMVCPRCDTWICYWCRKVIPKNVGYDHFWRQGGPCPPDRCPLWVENKQLHIIEAAKAKLDAKDELQT